jgi:hypothetical protein
MLLFRAGSDGENDYGRRGGPPPEEEPLEPAPQRALRLAPAPRPSSGLAPPMRAADEPRVFGRRGRA